MSGCIGNGHGINAWETQEPEEIVAGRNHIAHLLNQEQEGAYEIDEVPQLDQVPLMPFGYYRGKQLDLIDERSVIQLYYEGYFDAYLDCLDWIEKNLIS